MESHMKKTVLGLYAAVVLVLLAWGYYQAIYVAPNDAMQGEIFRIIYYHVPSFATAFCMFAVSLAGSIGFLAYRRSHPNRAQISDALALAAAEIGVVFCSVGLTTGPLWARRAWSIWWTWDARLTTTLVLWLIYVSYLLLRRFAAGPQMQTLAAVLGIFGAIDVPIVYMANRWWRTQHPAPVFGGGEGSGMDPSMTGALMWNMLAWFAWGILILLLRYRLERQNQMAADREAQDALQGRAREPQESASASRKLIYGLVAAVAAGLFIRVIYLVVSSPQDPALSDPNHNAIVAQLDHAFRQAGYAITWAIQLAYVAFLGLNWRTEKRIDR
jgi:heme exporter protein C